jgi:hypothetical protein
MVVGMPDQPAATKEISKSLLALTEQERARIRAEEIYRNEVRNELDAPKSVVARVFAFLNSPLGIFALSTLLLSGGTFVYTLYKESKDRANAKRAELVKLAEEVVFRENEFDETLTLAQQDSQLFLQRPYDSPDNPGHADATSYRIECREVGAVARAGGLILPPGDLTSDQPFRFGDVSLSRTVFPYPQGYKSPEYKFFNVTDLGKKAWKLEHDGKDASPKDVKELDDALHDLNRAALTLVRNGSVWESGTYAPSGLIVYDPHKLADVITPLVKDVRKAFELTRKTALLTEVVKEYDH